MLFFSIYEQQSAEVKTSIFTETRAYDGEGDRSVFMTVSIVDSGEAHRSQLQVSSLFHGSKLNSANLFYGVTLHIADESG